MNTLAVWLLSITGIALVLWIGWGLYISRTTAQPSYESLENLPNGVELRRYAEQTWISTPYTSDGDAFSQLGSYIFGQNETQEKIAMTAPVITDSQMTFILPEGVDQETAPAPAGQNIAFETVAPRTVAALRFSWWTTEKRVAQKEAALLEALAANGITTIGTPFLMRYNDPFTPPFLRRNEVAVEVRR